MINICDFYPTLATVAGAKLPAGLIVDGRDFTPQLLGESQAWPRDWIFVELGRRWYDRDRDWKLNQVGDLFDMHGAPYTEPLVPADTQNPDAIAARKRLEVVLKELNPAGGIMDPGQGPGAVGRKKKGKKRAGEGPTYANAGAMDSPGNQNEDDE